MIKFATIMANCIENNLGNFVKKTKNYTENNDICLRGSFFAAHCSLKICDEFVHLSGLNFMTEANK